MHPETAEWFGQVKYDLDTATSLYKSKRYIYAVFMCHLALEKALKGMINEHTGKLPPKIHNLMSLLKLADAKLTEDQKNFLTSLGLAGVATRYPEELGQLVNEYPREVVQGYLKRTREVIKCLVKQLK